MEKFNIISGAHTSCAGETIPSQPVEHYLTLDLEDFRCLTRGGILHVSKLRICLQDIGLHKMFEAIIDVHNGVDYRKDHIKKR